MGKYTPHRQRVARSESPAAQDRRWFEARTKEFLRANGGARPSQETVRREFDLLQKQEARLKADAERRKQEERAQREEKARADAEKQKLDDESYEKHRRAVLAEARLPQAITATSQLQAISPWEAKALVQIEKRARKQARWNKRGRATEMPKRVLRDGVWWWEDEKGGLHD